MITEPSKNRTKTLRIVAPLIGILTIFVGGMVLVGWTFDITLLKSIRPDWVSMKPNTAIGFVLTGFAILFAPGSALFYQPSTARLARWCGGVVGLIGLLLLIEYATGWNPGFDQWFFHEPVGTVGTSHAGRMAPDTALCFALLAIGLELARQSNRGTR